MTLKKTLSALTISAWLALSWCSKTDEVKNQVSIDTQEIVSPDSEFSPWGENEILASLTWDISTDINSWCPDQIVSNTKWSIYEIGVYWKIINTCMKPLLRYKWLSLSDWKLALTNNLPEISEINKMMQSNPDFINKLSQDLILLQDKDLVSKLRDFRKYYKPNYDTSEDRLDLCSIAVCDTNWGVSEEQLYYWIKNEYDSAYNLLWLLDRNNVPISFANEFFSHFALNVSDNPLED